MGTDRCKGSMDRNRGSRRSTSLLASLVPLFVAVAVAAPSALAQAEAPAANQPAKGVRGKVVIDPALTTGKWPIGKKREDALRAGARARRPMRAPSPMVEATPALTVMLEGDGLRGEPESPRIVLSGMRFQPASLVLPRSATVTFVNEHRHEVKVVDETGAVIAKVPPGGEAPGTLTPGERTLSMAEYPFALATARVLERGRVLPLKNGEIPLTDIPSGDYMLTFFLGAEPLRVQQLAVPDGQIFLDATVSAKGVVDVSVKDATLRVAVPVSNTPGPREDVP